MMLTPAGPAPRPLPDVPLSSATMRGTTASGLGMWLLTLLVPLTYWGLHLLLGGAVVLGWAVVGGFGGGIVIMSAGLAMALWWRRRRSEAECSLPTRCDEQRDGVQQW